jgi:predicted HAD superfamily Cof-like phosphohydrolase
MTAEEKVKSLNHQLQLMGQALGDVLEAAGMLNGLPATGPELLMFAEQFVQHSKALSARTDAVDWFADVLAFHAKFGCYVGSLPSIPADSLRELRTALVDEEVGELHDAMMNCDLPTIADSIVDSIYVLCGYAITYGIDIRPVWREVHAANMRKVGGSRRADGKVMKPEGWVPPDVGVVLAKQGPLMMPEPPLSSAAEEQS